ncbi:MAG: carbohydrate kinase family protein [Solobacterium sp.]|nr:carbohydrate kinase family protein [Solobacterium sp.]
MMKTKECEVLCIGVALIDSIVKNLDPNPVSASGYRAVSGSLHVGGEAANEALALAKLGHRPAVLCNLGQDEAGELVLHRLSEAGADTSLIRRSEHPTPVTTMFVKDDGTRQSITNQAHFYNFHPEKYLNESLRPKVLILGSLFRAPFDDPPVTEAVLRYAHELDIPVFADTKLPNSRPCTLEEIRTSLPMITYITPNEDEARYYTGKEDPEEMAEVFLQYGVKNVIIKLGGKGCYFRNKEISYSLPAYMIKAVDATGAGDNFLAGFVSELLHGGTVEEALRFANACGAICTTAAGSSAGLKNREQVLEFMKQEIFTS